MYAASAALEVAAAPGTGGPAPVVFAPRGPGFSARQRFIRIEPHHPQQRPSLATSAVASRPKAGKGSVGGQRGGGGDRSFVSLDSDGTDLWRLDPVIDALKAGAVGIIPTDSHPAFVCDLEDKAAVQRLYELKGINPSKKLSIMCRDLRDVATYTLGFPASNAPGQPDMFKVAKRALPGPYTMILHASKALPKQVTNYVSGKSKHRTTVGVRMPDDPVCQYILQQLDRPLLCSTAKGGGDEDEDGAGLVPDAAVLLDLYGPRGLDFVVDAGPRAADNSTVIDLSGPEAVLVRQGAGDASIFVAGLD